jgi:hypothetical protein
VCMDIDVRRLPPSTILDIKPISDRVACIVDRLLSMLSERPDAWFSCIKRGSCDACLPLDPHGGVTT